MAQTMKLYYFPVAPNPTKVRLYLAEKGIEVETVRIDIAQGEQRSPEYLAINPLGKLPTLALDDGTYVRESLAIIEYFEEIHPDPPMLGTTPEERARARATERLVDLGVLMPTARVVHATRSPLGLPPNPVLEKTGREALATMLPLVDAALADQPFVAGERVTVGDCTLWAALRFGEFFGVEPDPRYENIARWKEEFARRPSTNLPA